MAKINGPPNFLYVVNHNLQNANINGRQYVEYE